MIQMSDTRLREIADAHSDIRPADLARISGREVRDVISALTCTPNLARYSKAEAAALETALAKAMRNEVRTKHPPVDNDQPQMGRPPAKEDGHPVRDPIREMLKAGPMKTTDVAAALGAKDQTAVFHLRMLEKLGEVSRTKVGHKLIWELI